MRRILDYILIGLFSMMLSGCVVQNQSITASADLAIASSTLEVNKIIKRAKETLKGENGEKKEQVFVSFDEYEEDFEYEDVDDYEEYLKYWTAVVEKLDEKKPVEVAEEKKKIENHEHITETFEVPIEIKEEYNKRQLEKEKGIFYNPQNIHNEYNGFSDAEIIEVVNAKYLELHNNLRKELGLSTFTEDDTLKNIATIRAEESSYFFSHTRPNGDFFGKMIPTNREYGGENLECIVEYEPYMEVITNYTVVSDRGFEGLCNSPPHYEAIIDPIYTKIGIDSYVVHYDDGGVKISTAFEFSS